MIILKVIRTIILPFVFTTIFVLPFFSIVSADEIQTTTFDERYQEWINYKNSFEFSLSSDSLGTTSQEWDAIVNLGPAYLPYILDKMDFDPAMSIAFTTITRISIDKEKFQLISDPLLSYMDNYVNYYRNWWQKELPETDESIATGMSQYLQAKASGNNEQAAQILTGLEKDFGIFILPYIIPQIEQGDRELTRSAEKFISVIEPNEQTVETFKKTLSAITTMSTRETKRTELILDVIESNPDRIQAIVDLIPKPDDNGDSD